MDKICSVDSCNNKQFCKGFCKKHYYENRKANAKTCSVDGCNNKVKQQGLCSKHYTQIYRHGKILERTIYDKNDIEICDDYVKIFLYDKQCNIIGYTIVDHDDYEKIKNYKLGVHDSGYVNITLEEGETKLLHRYIMNVEKEDGYYIVVDHINHNTMDNRKSNLRVCEPKENARNTRKKANNTSGYRNISWNKQNNSWICTIRKNNKTYTKSSKDLEFLIQWRNEKLKELHGEFAYIDKN